MDTDEADRREAVDEAVDATATGAEEETNECDECYAEAPVRQMSLSRGSLVCASCVTSRAARVLSTFHIRDPPKKTTDTKNKNKTKKKRIKVTLSISIIFQIVYSHHLHLDHHQQLECHKKFH